MMLEQVIERVRAVDAVHRDPNAVVARVSHGLREITALRSWLAAVESDFAGRLATTSSFPERDIAECTRGSTHDATRTRERSATLGRVRPLADALQDGKVTPGHVDALTRIGKQLDTDQERDELFDRAGELADIAAASTVEEYRRRLKLEADRIRRGDGMDRLDRQRRNTRLRTWTDDEGMWRFDGRFDPVTGLSIANRLDAAVQALFAEAVPDTAPTDPIEKQHHLRALAFARLVGEAVGGRPGRPELIVVIDADHPNRHGEPTIDWGLPVEIPARLLEELADRADVHPVIVRNGVVLHAPGQLDLGRSTRLASPAQRRALRALYATCAVPGCTVPYHRCKLHHVTWWRNGGRTDLDNLLPLCPRCHTRVHHAGWHLDLGTNRQLTIRLPDGNILTAGPPGRRSAA